MTSNCFLYALAQLSIMSLVKVSSEAQKATKLSFFFWFGLEHRLVLQLSQSGGCATRIYGGKLTIQIIGAD